METQAPSKNIENTIIEAIKSQLVGKVPEPIVSLDSKTDEHLVFSIQEKYIGTKKYVNVPYDVDPTNYNLSESFMEDFCNAYARDSMNL